MRAALQTLCEQFIFNRDEIKQAAKWNSTYMYPVCAHLYCAAGKQANQEKLLQIREMIRQQTGVFSQFRGNIQLPLMCLLAMEEDPADKLRRVLGIYQLLRKDFMASDFLVLGAFLLSGKEDSLESILQKVSRGNALYRRIRKLHPFLTGSEDSVFALLLTLSPKDDDALMSEIEETFHLLRTRFKNQNEAQRMSHILAMAEGTPQDKAERVIRLYDAITLAGGKYGKYYEMPALAALSMLNRDEKTLSMDIMDVYEYLGTQSGYGFWGLGKTTRLMHAVMIVSLEQERTTAMDAAILASTLSLIIAQQAAAATAAT